MKYILLACLLDTSSLIWCNKHTIKHVIMLITANEYAILVSTISYYLPQHLKLKLIDIEVQ